MSAAPVDLSAAMRGRSVFVTGHTGFKGSWLVSWLHDLGAKVTGYALPPPTDQPTLFGLLELDRHMRASHVGDIRDLAGLREAVRAAQPDLVLHLAAQPLVRRSYDLPLETFDVNVRGTATLLEAIRLERRPTAVVIVTSDKCYQNREWSYAYREDDALGGHDPYSASKAATELVVDSYRRSFFAPAALASHGVGLASARAGNVIGGGDWGHERLLPMVVAALAADRPVELRAPNAVRPWQHVLEPLAGYLELGVRLMEGPVESRRAFSGAWNLGPHPADVCTVQRLVELSIAAWGAGAWCPHQSSAGEKHEAMNLRLATDKALAHLTWRPRWGIETAVAHSIAWYRAFHRGVRGKRLVDLTAAQIAAFTTRARGGAGEIATKGSSSGQGGADAVSVPVGCVS